MKNRYWIAIALTAMFAACDDDETTTTETTSDGSGGTTDDSTSTGDTSSTGSSLDDDEGSGTGGHEHAECPADPADDACMVCLKDLCCDELAACAEDENCGCVVSCVEELGDPMACLDTCGELSPATESYGACRGSCDVDCGGNGGAPPMGP